MQLLKDIFQQAKTVLKFVWRHFFTILIACWHIQLLVNGWTLTFFGMMVFLISAASFDYFKLKFKSANRQNSGFQTAGIDKPLHMRDYWNSNLVGSPSYLSSIGTSSKYY